MNLKVCGITQIKQLYQLDGMQIPYAGLIFYEKSPRYMAQKIDGKELRSSDLDINLVGVFVDQPASYILKMIDKFGLNTIQLHGNEAPDFCESLNEEYDIIKSFSLSDDDDIDELIADYDEVCDYYLFDTKTDMRGGSGKKFNWQKVLSAKIEKPFFLSGGISLADANEINSIDHPDFFGVDVNSRFEKEPGLKDMAAVLTFKRLLKA